MRAEVRRGCARSCDAAGVSLSLSRALRDQRAPAGVGVRVRVSDKEARAEARRRVVRARAAWDVRHDDTPLLVLINYMLTTC